MITAYFDYNPVGPSLYVLEEDGKEPRETTISMPDGHAMVEAICGFMAQEGVQMLYCNKAGMGLAPAIKQYVLKEYNNTTLNIEEY